MEELKTDELYSGQGLVIEARIPETGHGSVVGLLVEHIKLHPGQYRSGTSRSKVRTLLGTRRRRH